MTMYMPNDEIQRELLMMKQRLDVLEKREIEFSIEEISLCKLAKKLHRGPETIKKYVREGRLEGRPVPDRKSKTGFTFVFKISDVIKFQDNEKRIFQKSREFREPLSAYDIAKREIARIHKSK